MTRRLRRHAEPSATLTEALLRKAASAAVLVAGLLAWHSAAGIVYARHVADVKPYDLTGVPVAVPIVDPEPAPGTTPTRWFTLPAVTPTVTSTDPTLAQGGSVGGIGGKGQSVADYAASQAIVWAGETKAAEEYRLCVRLAEIKPYLELVCVAP